MGKNGTNRARNQLNRYREWLLNVGKLDCGICMLPIEDIKDLTVDHIKPRALGGRSSQVNMQPAHAKCNVAKGHKIILLPPYPLIKENI